MATNYNDTSNHTVSILRMLVCFHATQGQITHAARRRRVAEMAVRSPANRSLARSCPCRPWCTSSSRRCSTRTRRRARRLAALVVAFSPPASWGVRRAVRLVAAVGVCLAVSVGSGDRLTPIGPAEPTARSRHGCTISWTGAPAYDFEFARRSVSARTRPIGRRSPQPGVPRAIARVQARPPLARAPSRACWPPLARRRDRPPLGAARRASRRQARRSQASRAPSRACRPLLARRRDRPPGACWPPLARRRDRPPVAAARRAARRRARTGRSCRAGAIGRRSSQPGVPRAVVRLRCH